MVRFCDEREEDELIFLLEFKNKNEKTHIP
jgi:hypothetical protein